MAGFQDGRLHEQVLIEGLHGCPGFFAAFVDGRIGKAEGMHATGIPAMGVVRVEDTGKVLLILKWRGEPLEPTRPGWERP